MDSLSNLAPLAGVVAALVAGIGIYLNYRYTRMQRLSDRLVGHLSDERRADWQQIIASDPTKLVADKGKRIAALHLLLGLQQIATSVSHNAGDWDHALTHDDHELILRALQQSTLLIQIVQRTNWDVEIRAWNGSRKRAFRSLLTAFRVSLPVNR